MIRFRSRVFSTSPARATVLLAATLFSAGCNPMTPQDYTDFDYPPAGTPSPSGVVPPKIPTLPNGRVNIDTSKPILFARHKFSAVSYSAYGCKVRYAGVSVLNDADDELQISSSSVKGYPDVMGQGGYNFRNFPLPAEVSWRDKGGEPHQATVDISAIFRDQVVQHKVPQEQLPPILTADIEPAIVLEINDRTIRVWMRGRVPTKDLQIPGNQYSRYRSDLILAYSKTY